MPTSLDFIPEGLASEIYSCIEQVRRWGQSGKKQAQVGLYACKD